MDSTKMNKMNTNRKGQITIFLIVGIVLLFSSALIFYIRGQSAEGIPPGFIDEVTQVPNEARPIQIFVEQCLQQTAQEGIEQIGLHGGYVDVTDPQYTQGKSFSRGITPTDSDVVVFTGYPFGDAARERDMPYWWRMDSPNDCVADCEFSDAGQPGLTRSQGGENSIESQIETYIEENIGSCYDGFNSLEQIGFTLIEQGSAQATVVATTQDVAVRLEQELTFEKGQSFTIDAFVTRVNVRLKEIYDLADAIAVAQKNSRFLELAALDLIAINTEYPPHLTGERLPPIGEITFDQGQYAVWTTQDVQEKIEQNVLPFLNRLRVDRAANYFQYNVFNSDLVDQDQMQLVADKYTVSLIDVDNETIFPHVDVDFTYLDWWPIYLDLNGQAVIKPDKTVFPILPFIAYLQYQTFYDVSFPVLVHLKDDSAFNGKGYHFYYFLEGNIRNNKPYLQGNVTIPSARSTPQLACRPQNYNAGPLNLTIQNTITKTGIPDAIINFNFGSDSCYLGKTDEQGTLTAPLPAGIGLLSIFKDGYLAAEQPYLAVTGESDELILELLPEFELNAQVQVLGLNYAGDGTYSAGDFGPVGLKDSAGIILTRVSNDSYGEYQAFVNIDNETRVTGQDGFKIVPGTYSVEGVLLHNEETTIKGGTIGKRRRSATVDDINLSSVYHGGVTFNNETGLITFEPQELVDARSIVFKLLSYPLPEVITNEINDLPQGGLPDIAGVTNVTGATLRYKERLQPDIIT